MSKVTVAKQKIDEINRELKKSLKEIDNFEKESIKKIEDSPFIKRNKDFFWRFYERMHGMIQDTPYEKMVRTTKKNAEELRKLARYNAQEKIIIVSMWKNKP